MMRTSLLLALTLISGCSLTTHHTKIWMLCYKDDTQLPNGMWQSNELYLKCDKRRIIQFQRKFGRDEDPQVITDFKRKD